MKKKKETRTPEDLLSIEKMRIEIEMLRTDLSIVRDEVMRFQNTVYPLVESIVEASIRIARGGKVPRQD